MLTELEAVNEMLAAIPEPPVSSLDDEMPEEASTALLTLRRVSEDVQRMGWTFNTEYDRELTPNGDSEIVLTDDVLKIEVDRRQTVSTVDPVPRGGRLYDRKNNVYTFTVNVTLRALVRKLDWDDLPDTARRYICLRAQRLFVARITKSQESTQMASVEETFAFRELKKEHAKNPRINMLHSPGLIQAFGWRPDVGSY
jgi:hypothetical protein